MEFMHPFVCGRKRQHWIPRLAKLFKRTMTNVQQRTLPIFPSRHWLMSQKDMPVSPCSTFRLVQFFVTRRFCWQPWNITCVASPNPVFPCEMYLLPSYRSR